MAVDRAAVDSARGVALIAEFDQGRVAFVRGLSAESAVTVQEIAGALARPDRIVLSPGATAAALYSPELGQVQSITGLKAEIKVNEAALVTDLGPVTAITVDDAGTILIAAPGGIHALRAGSAAVLVAQAQDPAAIVIWRDGFVYADRAANEIVAASTRDEFPELTVIAQERDGIASPAGLAVMGGRLLVAVTGSLVFWDLETGMKAYEIPSPAQPTTLRHLGGAVSLNDPGDQPLWLVEPGLAGLGLAELGLAETDEQAPRVRFVPAAARQ
ncbi:MAG: hypothetical protein R2762_11710 [Bryobacteraceae bacterium]